VNETIMHLENINYHYANSSWRLQDISLRIDPGLFIGIIGPNGAGKSTLLRIAAGIIKPHSGHISLAGRSINHLSRRGIARQLGYLPQNVTSIFDYRVEEIVAMGRFAHLKGIGFLQKHDIDIIDRCLDQTETTSFRNRPLSQLSGGEKQRVLLASVLAQEPKLLLLDEPTTGLDLHHQVAFFSLLAELSRQNIAIVVVTHDLNLSAQFCDTLLLMAQGRQIIQDSTEHVITQDILSQVYSNHVYVSRHPTNNKPIVLPKLT